MYCIKCGTQMTESTKFCPKCGEATSSNPQFIADAQFSSHAGTVLQLGKRKKLSNGAIVWSWVCLAANIALAVLLIMTYSALRLRDREENLIPIFIITLNFLCAGGYAVLLAGKKVGFYFICGAAVFSAIISVGEANYLQVALGFLNPLITWLLIKNNWKFWNEIDTNKKAAKETYQQQYEEQYKSDSFFWEHGKKYKTWSIINTCLFFPFVLPILAIFESDKAKKAKDKETHDRHIKKALIFNLGTYALLIPFSVIMNFLQSNGMI